MFIIYMALFIYSTYIQTWGRVLQKINYKVQKQRPISIRQKGPISDCMYIIYKLLTIYSETTYTSLENNTTKYTLCLWTVYDTEMRPNFTVFPAVTDFLTFPACFLCL